MDRNILLIEQWQTSEADPLFLERKKYSGLEGLESGPEVDLPVLQAQLGTDILSVGDN
jgi:hypothetical protein